MKLTSRQTAPSLGVTDLLHVVLVNDQSQDPNGSSYKATIQQVVDLLTVSTNGIWVSGSTGMYSIKAVNDSGLDATGNYAMAEGGGTTASGAYSHAEGFDTSATGIYSHSEGVQTLASGVATHAEGYQTIASGDISHAQGNGTIAEGVYSFASGNQSYASGHTSFVHGINSVAAADYSIVFGNNITGTTANTTYVDSLNINTVGVYADNAAAISGGLPVGAIYRTSTGQLMIRY